MKQFFLNISLFIILFFFAGCKAFMHGYTWNKAENSYNLVTGNNNNFGDRRLNYTKGFHKQSALSGFLDCKCNDRGLPDFIYEYKTPSKARGIKLFYVQRDSVFVFEEPKKNSLNSIQKDARKMDDYERETYARLKQNR